MDLFNELLIIESRKASEAEIRHYVSVINKIYNEWRKIKRRINAVDLITTSVNKISTIHPDSIPFLHEEAKLKLATIIMRSLDIPPWKSADSKKSIYRKLYPLLSKMQTFSPNTGSGGNLREVIMTRLSATLAYNSNDKVFVGYEPVISNSYIKYLFSDKLPEKVYKMQAMSLPEDYDSLLNTLKINQDKCIKAFKLKKKAD